jgi:hypothetical protein
VSFIYPTFLTNKILRGWKVLIESYIPIRRPMDEIEMMINDSARGTESINAILRTGF